jgi:shikimate kinase
VNVNDPVAILIGPPGAGKTTVGGLLARLLGVGYLDTDASVEAVAGKPVGDIFVEDGEPAFRKLERAAVAAAIAGHPGPPPQPDDATSSTGATSTGATSTGASSTGNGTSTNGTTNGNGNRSVIGLGGGAVLDEDTQALLTGRPVVYLETGFTELAKRVGLDKPRPLLIGINPRAQLKSLLEQRRPVYAGLARITVLTDGREPAEIAAEIATLMEAAGLVSRQPGQ